MNEQLLIELDIEGTRHERVMRSQEGAKDWENLQKNLEAPGGGGVTRRYSGDKSTFTPYMPLSVSLMATMPSP